MDRELLAEECLEIERSGGDVLGHLADVGCVSPWGTWFRLQKEQLGRSIDKITDGKGIFNMKGKSMRLFATRHEMMDACLVELDAGRSPMPMLAARGYARPDQSWRSIRKWAEANEPEEAKRMPQDLRKWLKEKREEKETMKQTDLLPDDEEYADETEMKVEPEATVRPAKCGGMTVRCLEGQCGTYFWDPDHSVIDFDNGSDCLSLSPASWRLLIDELTKAANLMGVTV